MTTLYERRLRRGRRTWDLASMSYYGAMERLRHDMDELAVRHVGLRPGQSVLDIGCGTGAAMAALREAVGPGGRVVGVDYSPRMLAKARRRIRENGWSNVTVLRADAARESLGHNEFDAAVAMFSLSAMPDVRAAVESACEALRPGGRLFVIDMRLVIAGNARRRLATRLMRGVYRATAGFTGADVLGELRRTFGSVTAVVPSGDLGTTMTMVVATRSAD